ncbi:unnamed protein product, partial [Brenthis ino]
MEETSEASYCEKESWDEWGSRSSLSQQEEIWTSKTNSKNNRPSFLSSRHLTQHAKWANIASQLDYLKEYPHSSRSVECLQT